MIRYKISIERLIALIFLVAVSISLILDTLYHLGYFNKPAFIKNRIPPYHWKINFSTDFNYLKSSLPYLADIKEIEYLMEPGSVFYSDVATSYYVVTSSTSYAANPKSNHRSFYNRATATASSNLLDNLCNGGKYDGKYNTLNDYFMVKNSVNIRNGWGPIKYFIYNKDQINKNVINCPNDQYGEISEKLAKEFKVLFKGEYLDLYQIIE